MINNLIILNMLLSQGYEHGKSVMNYVTKNSVIMNFAREVIDVYDNMCNKNRQITRTIEKECLERILSIANNYFQDNNCVFVCECKKAICACEKDNVEHKFYEYMLILRAVAANNYA